MKKLEYSAMNKIFKMSSFRNNFDYAKDAEMHSVRGFV